MTRDEEAEVRAYEGAWCIGIYQGPASRAVSRARRANPGARIEISRVVCGPQPIPSPRDCIPGTDNDCCTDCRAGDEL